MKLKEHYHYYNFPFQFIPHNKKNMNFLLLQSFITFKKIHFFYVNHYFRIQMFSSLPPTMSQAIIKVILFHLITFNINILIICTIITFMIILFISYVMTIMVWLEILLIFVYQKALLFLFFPYKITFVNSWIFLLYQPTRRF